jgi:proteasome lid subunit RPN8/RPN11/LysM repeat protein
MNNIDNDVDIDILEPNKVNPEIIQLPLNFISVGNIESDDVKVYINQDILQFIEKFSSSDKGRELGGILIGDFVDELGKMHVVISGYIEAKFTDASSSTLTFTHETWDYIHSEHKRLYPDKKIIGWHHTHPSYGIFLSNYDLFIQQNFFNLPWQIAYVVDPINSTRGFFQWKNEKVQKLNGFFIYDDLQKKIKPIDSVQTKDVGLTSNTVKKRNAYVTAFAAVVLAGSIVLSTSLAARLDTAKKALATVQADNNKLNEKYKGLIDENNQLSDQLSQLQHNASENPDQKDNTEGDGSIMLQVYTVKRGDTVADICRKLDIDYASQKMIIKAVNQLDDLNKIYTGQKLLFPKYQ